MNYMQELNQLLYLESEVGKPAAPHNPIVIDLFAGCGGLALGFEAQILAHGFEMNADCCATYENNLSGTCTQIVLTKETPLPKASVVIGGPPCQPFSVGGHQKGLKDSRDGLPIFIEAITGEAALWEKIRPQIWLFENVRGLLYRNKWYLNEIVERMRGLGYIVESPMQTFRRPLRRPPKTLKPVCCRTQRKVQVSIPSALPRQCR